MKIYAQLQSLQIVTCMKNFRVFWDKQYSQKAGKKINEQNFNADFFNLNSSLLLKKYVVAYALLIKNSDIT